MDLYQNPINRELRIPTSAAVRDAGYAHARQEAVPKVRSLGMPARNRTARSLPQQNRNGLVTLKTLDWAVLTICQVRGNHQSLDRWPAPKEADSRPSRTPAKFGLLGSR